MDILLYGLKKEWIIHSLFLLLYRIFKLVRFMYVHRKIWLTLRDGVLSKQLSQRHGFFLFLDRILDVWMSIWPEFDGGLFQLGTTFLSFGDSFYIAIHPGEGEDRGSIHVNAWLWLRYKQLRAGRMVHWDLPLGWHCIVIRIWIILLEDSPAQFIRGIFRRIS